VIAALGDLALDVANLDRPIAGVASLTTATGDHLTFAAGLKYQTALEQTGAGAVILPQVPELVALAEARQLSWVTVIDPRLAFARAIGLFYQPFRPEPGIHPTAIVHPRAKLGEGVSIAPFVTVYEDVVLEDGVCLLPQVSVYPGVTIGAETMVHAGVTIYPDTQIGKAVLIHANATIGADGLGFVQTGKGWEKMPQSGFVQIGNYVEIGANTTIDRPAVGVTSIGEGTKLDNLVHIGHGCTIGEHCLLCAQTGLAGGASLGDFVILAGQVGVVDGVSVASGTVASGRTVIRQTIKKGQPLGGDPAMPLSLWLKLAAKLKRLV